MDNTEKIHLDIMRKTPNQSYKQDEVKLDEGQRKEFYKNEIFN